MSKYMQIKVAVTPFYQGDFAHAYPRLARHLGTLDRPLVEGNPSLYALAARIDQLLYTFDGTKLREVLLRHREKLQGLTAGIDENLSSWHLAQADKLLYQVEDVFEAIETELD